MARLNAGTTVLVDGWGFFPNKGHERDRAPNASHGTFRRLTVYNAVSRGDDEWGAGLYIEGHQDYDPPREVTGASALQALAIAFSVISATIAGHEGAFITASGPAGK